MFGVLSIIYWLTTIQIGNLGGGNDFDVGLHAIDGYAQDKDMASRFALPAKYYEGRIKENLSDER